MDGRTDGDDCTRPLHKGFKSISESDYIIGLLIQTFPMAALTDEKLHFCNDKVNEPLGTAVKLQYGTAVKCLLMA